MRASSHYPIHSAPVLRSQEVTSTIKLTTFLSAAPDRAWTVLKGRDSHPNADSFKILYQESYRKLVYEVFGLPKVITKMIGHIELQPDGSGTWLQWTVQFTTKPTMPARFFKLLMRVAIARTLRQTAREFTRRVDLPQGDPAFGH
jgi:hypothetical protein